MPQAGVTKAFAHRRAAEPIRREYLPGYHESRDGLKALGANYDRVHHAAGGQVFRLERLHDGGVRSGG